MIIDIQQSRLLVISDLHVGNPYSQAGRALGAFFDYATRERFNVCISGDGFEILQASLSAIASDSVDVMNRIRTHLDAGLKVYYVVGNHDIVLENFLSNWVGLEITPFVNLTSGEVRVRIEHGHLYDPSFVQSPVCYEMLTRLAGPFLRLYPDVYRLWAYYEEVKTWLGGLLSRKPRQCVYHEAAQMLLTRGFDAVVFGHTHRPERVEFGPRRLYINSGNWVRGGSYVEILEGRLSLKQWR